MIETNQHSQSTPTRRANNPLIALFSSVWFGIVLLSLLFIFCSIGSALPTIRQLPAIEMTEFEWFHWWPFDVLVLLFCINMATVTLRRIPLRPVNYGVWTIHAGIVVLALGSYLYFGTKVEGDAAVFRRQIQIQVPGSASPQAIVALPGTAATVPGEGGAWRFEVFETNTEAEVLDLSNETVSAYEVSVMVTPPTGERFLRYLYADQDHFTRDLIPGQGFAQNAIGRRLVNEDLSMTLQYEPTTMFHVMDTWALYVRNRGESDWVERPIDGLPRYNDRIGSREMVFLDPEDSIPLLPIDLEVPSKNSGDALSDASVRVTGYLRYAQMRQRWTDGGTRFNPVLMFSALLLGGDSQQFELVALDPSHNMTPGGGAKFVWLEDASQVQSLPTSTAPRLDIAVPATDDLIHLVITNEMVVGRDGPFTPIQETDLAYRIVALPEALSIPGKDQLVSVAMVEVKTPEGVFTRMVADQASMTKDIHPGNGDSGDPHQRMSQKPDPRLNMTFTPGGARFLFAGHPDGTITFIHNGNNERITTQSVAVGETINLEQGAFQINALLTHAARETKPFVVPKWQRRRNMGETFAMIRLEVRSGQRVDSRWVPFQQYSFPNDQHRYGGRFAYQPRSFTLTDGRSVEVLFSRQRLPLPHPVVLESFSLDEHAGGYSGSASTIRNYLCELRFQEDGSWTDAVEISVNNPTENGGYWYFQSTWDPPRDRPGSGMNYTGLGVGNRNGVYIQLAGSCIAVAGMFFAFYVKPILRRRTAQRAQAKVARSEPPGDPQGEFKQKEPAAV